MRRAVLAVTLLLATALPAAADDGMSIREVDASGAPEVHVTISTAEPRPVTAEDLRLFEDGAPVSEFTVTPLDTSGRPVDVVLALDVSGSMEGEPLAAAVVAARRFVEAVPGNVKVGLVTFADRSTVVQRLTDDHEAVLAALDEVVANGETSIYDGVVEAASLFSDDAQRNIILLSDGGDTASVGTLEDARAAAAAADASVFAIGWRTSETDIGALRRLARASGGRYASAASSDVESIYAGLAAELSSQHVVTYRSGRKDGGEVSITVDAPWGTDTAVVLFPEVEVTPEGPAPSEPEPYRPPLLRGVLGLSLSVGLVFIAALAITISALQVPLRRRRRRSLERRMGSRGSGAQADEETEGGAGGWIPAQLAAAGQAMAETAGFAERLNRRLEQAGVSLRPGEFVAGAFLAALVGGSAAGLLFQSAFWGLVAAVVAAIAPVAALGVAVRRRLNRLEEQVIDVLMIIASSLRAGHSFLQALDMVSKEISEPAAGEFSRTVSEIRLGRPIEDALGALGERMGSEDFDWAMMAVNIQREVGGNLAEVLDTVAETLRGRETVKRQIKVLAGEGKLSARILTVLPFLIVLYIAKVNPGFLDPLVSTFLGRVLLTGGGILMLAGIFIMRKLVRIDV